MDEPESQEPSLESLTLRLGGRNWRVVEEATKALANAGEAGIQAVIAGLSHPGHRIRKGCAEFMDHYGTQECVESLCRAALQDSIPIVRRVAVHSLACQRCKTEPLAVDAVAVLLDSIAQDSIPRVRYMAIAGLCAQPSDARVAPVLKKLLQEETNPKLLRAAHEALQRHDADYRCQVIEQAKARTMVQRPSAT